MPRSLRSSLLGLTAALAAVSCPSSSFAQILPSGVPDVVSTTLGPVQGVRSQQANLRYWLAIPYADTTGGANQFKPPQPRQPWGPTPLNVTTWGAGCIQDHHNPDVPKNESFDCLNVNVWAPLNATTGPNAQLLPVMVFVHGGAWLEGSNQGPFGIYGGEVLTQQGVVVIALNYRLGVYGWLAFDKETSDGESVRGNFGTQDQIAALKWVQANAANFGGDPNQVTIQGESAGAMSIGILLTSPLAKGLFHRGIMESNVGGFNYHNISETSVYSSTFCGLLNCSSPGIDTACNISCVRGHDQYTVQDAWNTATGNIPDFIITNLPHILDGLLGTGPTVDGEVITGEPLSFVESGPSSYWGSDVPLLMGTNTNEGQTFIYDAITFALPGFVVPIAYLGLFDFNESAATLVNKQPRYSGDAFADGRDPVSNVATDYWFRCASEKFVNGAYGAGQRQVFAYRFDTVYHNSSLYPSFGLPAICGVAVCHASELPFVFSELPSFASFNAQELTLSSMMVRYWTRFAKTGDPNGGNDPVWPAWTPTTRTTLVLNDTLLPGLTTESTNDMCGFWDSVGGYFF